MTKLWYVTEAEYGHILKIMLMYLKVAKFLMFF